jgi:hypothetical protein
MGLAITLMGVLTAWGAVALWYQASRRAWVRALAVSLWLLFACATLVASWHHPLPGSAAFAIACAGLLLWWVNIKPSNSRTWADDVAQMLHGSVVEDRVILQNVRNFDWRTRTDYTASWETRTYDLNQLQGADLIISYWSYTAIAHVLVSFGFTTGQHVVFSVEIRREKTEAYSEIGGFFKEFELSIIAADERDIVRLRTNVRGEDDYLYRLQLPAAARRDLFLGYVREANGLIDAPRFYNTLTANCTTLIDHMMRTIVGHMPLDYRLILSGYLPSYYYKLGALDTRHSLRDLRRLGRITERARTADRHPDFSAAIRAGIPDLIEPTDAPTSGLPS